MSVTLKAPVVLLMLICLAGTGRAQTFSVGSRTITYNDPARGNRAIQTELYYPADAAGVNVPVANGAQAFPLVVFGHGFVIPVSSYTWLADSLVKYGYILALPTTESSLSPSHGQFGADLAFLCSRIKSENSNPASFLFQRVAQKAAVGGHSMGGGASFLAAGASADVNALFNFAAAETNPSATAAALNVNKPSLVFSGSNDCIVAPSVQQAMYNNIPHPCKSWVNVTGATHCQFAANNGTCVFGQITSGCNSSPISTSILFGRIQQILRPFLDYYIKDICTRGSEYLAALSGATGSTVQTTCGGFSGCGPVPVSITRFSAQRTGNRTVRLSWQTDAEINVLSYSIERKSADGTLETLGMVDARNNNGRESYYYDDLSAMKTPALYRLIITDRDRSQTYSNWVSAAGTADVIDIRLTGANPGKSLQLGIYAERTQALRVIVFGTDGRNEWSGQIFLRAGFSHYQLPALSSLPAGLKRISIYSGSGEWLQAVHWLKQ